MEYEESTLEKLKNVLVKPFLNLLATPESDPNGINVCTDTVTVGPQMFTNQKYSFYAVAYLGALVYSIYSLMPQITGFNSLNGFPNLILSFFWGLFSFLMVFYLCTRFTKITKLCKQGVLYMDTSFSVTFLIIYLILIGVSMNAK